MKFFVLLIAGSFFVHAAFARDGYGSTSVYDRVVQFPKGKHLFRVPPNQLWERQPWKDSVYRFPSFQEGRLEMDRGFSPSFRPVLNYNSFTGSIQILASDGSKTSLKRADEIKAVWIGDHKFIIDPLLGYLEILVDGEAPLVQRTCADGLYELTNGFKYSLNSFDLTKSPSTIREDRYHWMENKIDYTRKDDLVKIVTYANEQANAN